MTTKKEKEKSCMALSSEFIFFFSLEEHFLLYIYNLLYACLFISLQSSRRLLGLQGSNFQGLMGGGGGAQEDGFR